MEKITWNFEYLDENIHGRPSYVLRLGPPVSQLHLFAARLKCKQAIRKKGGMRIKAELVAKISSQSYRTLLETSNFFPSDNAI